MIYLKITDKYNQEAFVDLSRLTADEARLVEVTEQIYTEDEVYDQCVMELRGE